MNGKGCEQKKEDHNGEGEWEAWEQEKGSREAMDVIQTVQCSTICSSCGCLVKDVFQCFCLAPAHAPVVLKQRSLVLGRNGDQIKEMV